MSELIFGEEFDPEGNRYWVKNDLGGIHIWYSFITNMLHRCGETYRGGIEVHSVAPLYDFEDRPTHDHCWLLNCPCYHDGSSLYFAEHIAPLIGSDGKLPLATARNILTDWHQSKFGASS
jgi:hypothetical protein